MPLVLLTQNRKLKKKRKYLIQGLTKEKVSARFRLSFLSMLSCLFHPHLALRTLRVTRPPSAGCLLALGRVLGWCQRWGWGCQSGGTQKSWGWRAPITQICVSDCSWKGLRHFQAARSVLGSVARWRMVIQELVHGKTAVRGEKWKCSEATNVWPCLIKTQMEIWRRVRMAGPEEE